MVGTEKREQRGQAVKRLRSLFDMHHVAFGSPENLGRVLLSLHENRHFAMDFWAVVGALTSTESGALSDDETLEVVVESATGKESPALAEYLQPGVIELRQMLAGVDVARPVELPDAISDPGDALLPRYKQTVEPDVAQAPRQMADAREIPRPMRVEQVAHAMPVDDARVARRSIGEALAQLEQTSRELREQLAAIEGQVADTGHFVETGYASETEPHTAESLSRSRWTETVVEVTPEVTAEGTESVYENPGTVEWNSTAPETHVERPPTVPVVPPAPVQYTQSTLPLKSVEAAHQPVEDQAAWGTPLSQTVRRDQTPLEPIRTTPLDQAPAQTMRETEVFAPRPVHTLSQRGLATPEPEDDPSITAPLSGYGADESRAPVARFAIAAVVLAALSAGGVYAARTDAGHAMLSSAGSSLHATYQNIGERLNLLKSEATTPVSPPTKDANDTPTPPESASSPTVNTPAPVTPEPPAPAYPTASSGNANAGVSAANPQPTVNPQPPLKKPTERSATTTRPELVESGAADESVLRVPASAMAAQLQISRVPAYPDSARAQEIEGPVVMDVVVGEDGAVKHVRVIDGDRHLRAAAEEAVMKWRYRPYLLNGSPVEITTTVRVDFRMPR